MQVSVCCVNAFVDFVSLGTSYAQRVTSIVKWCWATRHIAMENVILWPKVVVIIVRLIVAVRNVVLIDSNCSVAYAHAKKTLCILTVGIRNYIGNKYHLRQS